MEISIIQAAVARKMLCQPLNSLIADTEFACAAGMVLRILKVKEELLVAAGDCRNMKQLQEWLLESQQDELAGKFDMPQQNLIQMVCHYKAEENPFTEQLREIFLFGYREKILYPKGRFL